MNVDENVEKERERAFLARPSSCNSSPTVMMLLEFRDRVYSHRATGGVGTWQPTEVR